MGLTEGNMENIQCLIDEVVEDYPFFKGMVSGRIASQVYLKEGLQGLQAALVVNSLGWIYVLGKWNEDIYEEFKELLFQLSREKNGYLIIFGAEEKLVHCISADLERKTFYVPRIRFKFSKEKYSNRCVKSRTHGEIRKIDQNNIDEACQFDSSIMQFWNTKEEFLNRGFGFSIQIEGEIACQIISASVDNKEAEIDIRTAENCKRMGLAALVTESYIEHCIKGGITPKWDCIEKNIPSRKLAEKMGFEAIEKYPVIFVSEENI